MNISSDPKLIKCKKIIRAIPRYEIHELTPEVRRSLLSKVLLLDMDIYFPDWYKTLVGHHKTDLSEPVEERKKKEELKKQKLKQHLQDYMKSQEGRDQLKNL